jgi:copper(I)-binding protein
VLLLAAAPVRGQVLIEKPWARATVPTARVAGAYLTVRNQSAVADRLVGAWSPVAARVEFHIHTTQGEVMKMRQAQALDIPANGTLELKPGGAHLMFVDIRKPFTEGDVVPVTLRFEKAGEVSVQARVGGLADRAARHGTKHQP